MSSSTDDFEKLKQRQLLQTFEHVALNNEFVVDPELLVVFYVDDQETKVYGLHICSPRDLQNAILTRATELMHCSMVNPDLQRCEAKLVTRDGYAMYYFDPELFLYTTKKPKHADNESGTDECG